jgi:hypothetical protein
MHDRLTELHGGVVDDVTGIEVVATIDDHVVPGHELERVALVETERVHDDLDVRIQLGEGLLGGLGLERTYGLGVVNDLALKVACLDAIGIHDPNGPQARGGKIHEGWRSQAPGPDAEDLGVEKSHLALLADLRQDQVPGVTIPLRRIQDPGQLEVIAEIPPAREPAAQ